MRLFAAGLYNLLYAYMEPVREDAVERSMSDSIFPPFSSDAQTDESQQRKLAQDLLRVEPLAAQGSEAPPAPAQMPPNYPADYKSAGAALSQMLSDVSRRIASWGQRLLTTATADFAATGNQLAGDAFFYASVQQMNLISHALEERVIADRLRAEVHVGFQRLSLMQPQLGRYRALLGQADHVCVYGLDDRKPDSPLLALKHPRLIYLPIEPAMQTGLERFWFVVVVVARLQTALVAQQASEDSVGRQQEARTYAGLWTFDPALVQQITTILRTAAIKLYYKQV
jgi:DICT domain-containing protein